MSYPHSWRNLNMFKILQESPQVYAGHSYELYMSLCRVLRVMHEFTTKYAQVNACKYSGVTRHQCDRHRMNSGRNKENPTAVLVMPSETLDIQRRWCHLISTTASVSVSVGVNRIALPMSKNDSWTFCISGICTICQMFIIISNKLS